MYHDTAQYNYSSATPTPNLTYLLICKLTYHDIAPITLQQKNMALYFKTNIKLNKFANKQNVLLPNLAKKSSIKSLIKPILSILFDC